VISKNEVATIRLCTYYKRLNVQKKVLDPDYKKNVKDRFVYWVLLQ